MDGRVHDDRAAGLRGASEDATTRYVSILPDEVELVELSGARAAQPRGWLFVVGVGAAALAVVIVLLGVGAISVGTRPENDRSAATADGPSAAPTPSPPIADTDGGDRAPLGGLAAAIVEAAAPSPVVPPADDVGDAAGGSGDAGAVPVGRASGWTSLQDTAIAYYLGPQGSQCAILTLGWVAERFDGGQLSYSQHLDVQLSDSTCRPSEVNGGVDLDADQYRILGLSDAYVDTTLEVAGHAVDVDVAWTAVGEPAIYSDRWAGDTLVIAWDVVARLTGTVMVDGTPWRADETKGLLRSGTFTSFAAALSPVGDAAPSPSPATR